MKHLLSFLCILVCCCVVRAQDFNSIDENGIMTPKSQNQNFNKLHNDTTSGREIPKGIYVWTIDRIFGDIVPAEMDTVPHLYPNSTFNSGIYGQYNTTGNNYTARQNRVVIDRPLADQFLFVQPYGFVRKAPDELQFTNTLSPFTNLSYDNCGDKQNGEDHIEAKFAVNANKRLGFGFDLNYAYARGYYSNQSASHFAATLYGSYVGDRYQMHTVFSTYHQKVSENGGITDDNYITHPEQYTDSYAENEIPTLLQQNWNRNNSLHFFLTHRYSFGFYRHEKMTEEEMKAKEFAKASNKDKLEREAKEASKDGETDNRRLSRGKSSVPTTPSGRPEGARIAGEEPVSDIPQIPARMDSSRVEVDTQDKMDSLLAVSALEDSINSTMKRVYVPVTSFIHTLDYNTYDRIYQAYRSPNEYYADTFYDYMDGQMRYGGDSIYDQTKMRSVRNTLGIALLEGFNKYAKAGLKVFASHELRKFKMPGLYDYLGTRSSVLEEWTENCITVGGQLNKTQGNTFHYNLMAETCVAGEDIGQLKVNFATDLNFPLFGDSVTLAAKAYFYRLNPTFYQRNFHSKHLWWDENGLSKETRTRIEGLFTYRKTNTSLRVAIEEMQNYTYFGMSYDRDGEQVKNMSAGVRQCKSNINLLTAQLKQNFRLGILHWENILTYQNSSQEDVLPVPSLNLFTNLYLKFKIVNQLSVELGGDATWFSQYAAPEFLPMLNQYVVQENGASKVEIGNYPIVDIYANMHLKQARFFIMYSHANAGNGNKCYFLTPHYPLNGSVLHIGVSWNFYN